MLSIRIKTTYRRTSLDYGINSEFFLEIDIVQDRSITEFSI